MNDVRIERTGKDSFRVGDREVRTLKVGSDIFPVRTYVFDMKTEEYLGEFYGSPLPSFPELDMEFREGLIRVVYGRE
ncbi:MAG: hypothetical protein HYT73_00455 [Candidatus Aenigmarchaeota archaeon]|nr:hypothetical protein [Candidatus Aenigmarchaeota archaeon]